METFDSDQVEIGYDVSMIHVSYHQCHSVGTMYVTS